MISSLNIFCEYSLKILLVRLKDKQAGEERVSVLSEAKENKSGENLCRQTSPQYMVCDVRKEKVRKANIL